jgi:hypothetical protein
MPMALRGLATPLGVRKLLLHCSQTLFGDETRAIETFEYFSRRAVALCPPRWTITRSRVVAYVDIIEHEERAGVAPDHSLSATTAVRSEHRSRAATVTLISTRGWNVGRRVLSTAHRGSASWFQHRRLPWGAPSALRARAALGVPFSYVRRDTR